VRCTFDFYDKHLSTNIMVLRSFLGYLMQRRTFLGYLMQRRTFLGYLMQLRSFLGYLMQLRTFLGYLMQQSCKIFVEIHLKHITIGAEHRNI